METDLYLSIGGAMTRSSLINYVINVECMMRD
jgi:hypothetical protein